MSYVAEMNAKPFGLVIPDPADIAEFKALSRAQKGYFLHWIRSNQRCSGDWWARGMRKAREQRPALVGEK